MKVNPELSMNHIDKVVSKSRVLHVDCPSIQMLPPLGVRYLDFYLGDLERDALEDVLSNLNKIILFK